MRQRVVDGALLRLALVLLKIGPQLEFGLIGIQQKLLPGTECQPAEIAIGQAGCNPDKTGDFQISIWHGNMMARRRNRVKFSAAFLLVPSAWPQCNINSITVCVLWRV